MASLGLACTKSHPYLLTLVMDSPLLEKPNNEFQYPFDSLQVLRCMNLTAIATINIGKNVSNAFGFSTVQEKQSYLSWAQRPKQALRSPASTLLSDIR
jgi:hypothetical protein